MYLFQCCQFFFLNTYVVNKKFDFFLHIKAGFEIKNNAWHFSVLDILAEICFTKSIDGSRTMHSLECMTDKINLGFLFGNISQEFYKGNTTLKLCLYILNLRYLNIFIDKKNISAEIQQKLYERNRFLRLFSR